MKFWGGEVGVEVFFNEYKNSVISHQASVNFFVISILSTVPQKSETKMDRPPISYAPLLLKVSKSSTDEKKRTAQHHPSLPTTKSISKLQPLDKTRDLDHYLKITAMFDRKLGYSETHSTTTNLSPHLSFPSFDQVERCDIRKILVGKKKEV